jgi:uncharacterized protein YycO
VPDLKLQFSTTSGLISGIVRTVTWSRWSHVDCILDDGRLLGAQWDGVKIRPADYEKFSRKDCLTLSVTDSELATYMAFLTAQVGKKYDSTALFGILLHRDWMERDSWFCSELQAAAIVEAGILKISTNRNRVTPELLRQLLGTIAVSEVCDVP